MEAWALCWASARAELAKLLHSQLGCGVQGTGCSEGPPGGTVQALHRTAFLYYFLLLG